MKVLKMGIGSVEDLARILSQDMSADEYGEPVKMNPAAAKVQKNHVSVTHTLANIAKAVAWVVNVLILAPLGMLHKVDHARWVRRMRATQPELVGREFQISDNGTYRLKLTNEEIAAERVKRPGSVIHRPAWADELANAMGDEPEPDRPSVH